MDVSREINLNAENRIRGSALQKQLVDRWNCLSCRFIIHSNEKVACNKILTGINLSMMVFYH